MLTFYNILIGVGCAVAAIFSLLVFATGKGDAMSGGSGSVRTTFKGKASFDDYMSRACLYLGLAFMAIMLALDIIAGRYPNLFGK